MPQEDPSTTHRFPAGMGRLLAMASLALLPLAALLAVVYFTDIWGIRFGHDDPFKEQMASQIKYGRALHVMRYSADPKPNILLGDSRAQRIKTENIPSGHLWASLAFGGGTIDEAIDCFWFAAGLTDLDTVLWDMDTFTYKESVVERPRASLVRSFTEMSQSLILELTDKDVVATTFKYLWKRIFDNNTIKHPLPAGGREAFWKRQVAKAKEMADDTVSPASRASLLERLDSIANYCRERSIALIVYEPITHQDATDQLAEARRRYFLPDMARFFDHILSFQQYEHDSAEFGDPFHYTGDQPYIDGFWRGGDPRLSRVELR